GSHHDHVVRDHRRRTVADSSDEVSFVIQVERFKEIYSAIPAEAWDGKAGLRVQRDKIETRRDRNDPFFVPIGPVRNAPRIFSSCTFFPGIGLGSPGPQSFAGACIGCNDGAAWAEREVEDPVHHDWSRLRTGPAEVIESPAPRELEVLD